MILSNYATDFVIQYYNQKAMITFRFQDLRILGMHEGKNRKKPATPELFGPMVLRCKMCSHIPKVASGGRAEIEHLKVCHFFMFSISALSQDVTFGMSLHFLHL